MSAKSTNKVVSALTAPFVPQVLVVVVASLFVVNSFAYLARYGSFITYAGVCSVLTILLVGAAWLNLRRTAANMWAALSVMLAAFGAFGSVLGGMFLANEPVTATGACLVVLSGLMLLFSWVRRDSLTSWGVEDLEGVQEEADSDVPAGDLEAQEGLEDSQDSPVEDSDAVNVQDSPAEDASETQQQDSPEVSREKGKHAAPVASEGGSDTTSD